MDKIKLTFTDFDCHTNGRTTVATIKATIFNSACGYKYIIASKKFKVKITCKPEDTPDLNKVFKYCKAELELRAYRWAANKANSCALELQQRLKAYNAFVYKALNIVSHNKEYINKLN